jgi:hypothetical protein
VVDIQQQKQWQIYNTAITVADTRQQIHCGRYKWWIYRGKYTAVDIQRQIQQWIYNTADTVVDIQ